MNLFSQDIDECAEGGHNCTGACVNAVGTFRCADRGADHVPCGLGFRFDHVSHECQGEIFFQSIDSSCFGSCWVDLKLAR